MSFGDWRISQGQNTLLICMVCAILNCQNIPGGGQVWILQGCDSEALPVQVAPPLEGAGLLQRRVLVWGPSPQLALQVFQEVQSPQFPFTETIAKL